MIIGVDHVALSCSDVVRSSRELEQVGFSTQFIESGLPNHISKKTFLNHYSPAHDIAYCRREDGIAIELTDHHGSFGKMKTATTAYHVLFDAELSSPVPLEGLKPGLAAIWDHPESGSVVRSSQWIHFLAAFWYNSARFSCSSGIRSVALPVTRLSQSATFWQLGLGFQLKTTRRLTTGEEWKNFMFQSPVKRWTLDFVLIEDKEKTATSMLDAPGFRCLALITTDIAADLKRLTEVGGVNPTEPFILPTNHKTLRVAMLRGPSGEIIELIEFKTSKI